MEDLEYYYTDKQLKNLSDFKVGLKFFFGTIFLGLIILGFWMLCQC